MPAAVAIKDKRILSVKWAVILLFIVWPLLTLPFILVEIWNRRPYAFTLLALFMGLCAAMFAPVTDLYRHTLDYFTYRGLSWNMFLEEQSIDVLLPWMSFLFARAGIHFEIVRLLFVFTGYYILFYIFQDAVSRNEILRSNRRWYFAAFLTLLMGAGFFVATLGLRYALARSLIVLAAWQLLVQKRNNGYVWLLLAPATHISTVVFSACILLVKVRIFRINSRALVIAFFVIGYLVSFVVMQYIGNHLLGVETGQRLNVYVDGYWGTGGVTQDMSARGRMFSGTLLFRQCLMLLPLLLYKGRSAYMRFILLVFVLWGLTLPFYALGFRVSSLLVFLLLFWMLTEFDKTKRSVRLFVAAMSIYLLVFAFEIYSARDYIAISRMERLLYYPAPAAVCNTFDKVWIDEHIDGSGFPHGKQH